MSTLSSLSETFLVFDIILDQYKFSEFRLCSKHLSTTSPAFIVFRPYVQTVVIVLKCKSLVSQKIFLLTMVSKCILHHLNHTQETGISTIVGSIADRNQFYLIGVIRIHVLLICRYAIKHA